MLVLEVSFSRIVHLSVKTVEIVGGLRSHLVMVFDRLLQFRGAIGDLSQSS